MTPGLLTPSRAYKPIRYPFALEACRQQHRIHWIGESVPHGGRREIDRRNIIGQCQ